MSFDGGRGAGTEDGAGGTDDEDREALLRRLTTRSNSSDRQITALRRRAGLEHTPWPESDGDVASAVAAAVRDGRTVTLPMTAGSHVAHLVGAVLLALVILVAVVLARAFETPWTAALCAAGVGPFLLFHAAVALPGSGSLTLDSGGMRVRYAFRTREWDWAETRGFDRSADPHQPDGRPSDLAQFRSTRPEDTRTDLLNYLGVRGLTLTTRIPDRYGLDARTLTAVLDRTRAACAGTHGPAGPQRETGSTTAALLLNVVGAAAAVCAFAWFAVFWIAPDDPVVVLVCVALIPVLMAPVLLWLRRYNARTEREARERAEAHAARQAREAEEILEQRKVSEERARRKARRANERRKAREAREARGAGEAGPDSDGPA